MRVDETRQDISARQIEDGSAARRMIAGGWENGPNMSAFNFDRAPCLCDAMDNVDYSDVIKDQ